MKKILILYTGFSWGHKTIAENIATVLIKEGFDVKLADVLEVEKGRLVSFGKNVMKIFYRYIPWIWGFLYKSKIVIKFTLPFRTRIGGRKSEKVLGIIEEFKPNLVISTQVNASAVVAALKQKKLYNGKFGIAFSDYHFHPFWVFNESDFYLVNIPEQKQEMVKLGLEPEKIAVCGFTLKTKGSFNIFRIKEKFNINLQDKVILIGNGSRGVGFDKGIIKDLLGLKNIHIILFSGKNKKLKEKMKRYLKNKKLTVLGFCSSMEELYAITDIFVTKPGGMSVAESLSWGLPMVIINNLPGQEELNYKYLEKHNLAMVKPRDLESVIREELSGGNFKKQLKENSKVAELVQYGEPVRTAVGKLLHRDAPLIS